MDFLFTDEPMTDEEQAALEAEIKADREARRLREKAAMEKMEREKAAEERWYPKQRRVLKLEDCFKQNALLLSQDDKQEFEEFIPKITFMLEKDADMIEMMGELKDERDWKTFLTTWYNTFEFGTDDKELLDDFLAKFEKQVFAALRLKANLPLVSSSQMHYDFFTTLKEKVFHKEMRKIRPTDISRKLREKQRDTMETTKTAELISKAGLRRKRIEKPEEESSSSSQHKISSPEPKRKQEEDGSWLDEVSETTPPVSNDDGEDVVEITPSPQAVMDIDDDDDIIEIFPCRQDVVVIDDDDDDIIEIFPDRQ